MGRPPQLSSAAIGFRIRQFSAEMLETWGDAQADLSLDSLLLLGGGVGEHVRPPRSEAQSIGEYVLGVLGVGEYVLGVLGVGEHVLFPVMLQLDEGGGV